MAEDQPARPVPDPIAFSRRLAALGIDPSLIPRPRVVTAPSSSGGPSPPVPSSAAARPMDPLPAAPPANPLAQLAFPSAGDRIRAEDFRALAQSLRLLSDTYALAGATFGQPFGLVKLALAAQQYEVVRVLSVNGTELSDPTDSSLDDRRVISVAPVVLGERRVAVVVAEPAVERRGYMPDLTRLTYRQALDRLRSDLGDVVGRGGPLVVPNLRGMTVAEATRRISLTNPPATPSG